MRTLILLALVIAIVSCGKTAEPAPPAVTATAPVTAAPEATIVRGSNNYLHVVYNLPGTGFTQMPAVLYETKLACMHAGEQLKTADMAVKYECTSKHMYTKD